MSPIQASSKSGRIRLDQALTDLGLCESREKAKRAVLAGQVRVNEQRVDKPGHLVRPSDQLALDAREKYVSRGGLKLERALADFQIAPHHWIAIDLGASTGGFTDCLLQHGASKVYAVDVGHGQLAWKLRQDPRVVVMEKTNARQLAPQHFPEPADLAVIDCSFISLRLILPVAARLIRPGGRIVALIKPQFEAGKEEADRGGGVIRDPAIHRRILTELEDFTAQQTGLTWRQWTESPLLGPAGNREFFTLIEKAN